MENHKEIMKAKITYFLLILLLFGMPTCIRAIVTHNSRVEQNTVSNDSLSSRIPDKGTKQKSIIADIPPIYEGSYQGKNAKGSGPVKSITHLDPDLLIPKEGYSVGSPEGAISVNNSGAAVYRLNIEIPIGGA